MRTLFKEAVAVMTAAFRRLEDRVPRPKIVAFSDGEALRYAEQSTRQALIAKCARYISGLNAIDTLLIGGFVQEQATIQRTLDEVGEDISFLAMGVAFGETGLHRRYLSAFWQEEFEEGVAPIDNTRGRYRPSRRDIRSALAKHFAAREQEIRSGAILSQTYSGYVHAAGPHLLEMCGGPDLRFHVNGLRGTSRMREHIEDAWNYAYRGLLAITTVAHVFGEDNVASSVRSYISRFEAKSGTSYMNDVRGDPRSEVWQRNHKGC